ncbi:MAG: hypothetical protein WKG32_10790 [Gemmatimonadaceae bacterium]
MGQESRSSSIIAGAHPSQSGGLQVIDYYLWALQRMYERGEDRFFESLAAGYRLIMDCDDTRQHDYGQYFTQSDRLTLEKMKPVTEARFGNNPGHTA